MRIQEMLSFIKKSDPEDPYKGKSKMLLLLGVAGVLLLVISSLMPNQANGKSSDAKIDPAGTSDWVKEQEAGLEDLISQIEGVGNTQVMITLETESETVYATDRRTDSDSVQEEYVLLSGSSKGLVETVWMPQVQGVAIVCQGADSAAVQSKITEMVSVLMGISSNRISIARMSESR